MNIAQKRILTIKPFHVIIVCMVELVIVCVQGYCLNSVRYHTYIRCKDLYISTLNSKLEIFFRFWYPIKIHMRIEMFLTDVLTLSNARSNDPN